MFFWDPIFTPNHPRAAKSAPNQKGHKHFSKLRHNLLNTRMCPRRLAAPPGFAMLTKFQEEPSVQGIDAQSNELWCDMKFNARFVVVRDVPSSTIVVLWHPHPFE